MAIDWSILFSANQGTGVVNNVSKTMQEIADRNQRERQMSQSAYENSQEMGLKRQAMKQQEDQYNQTGRRKEEASIQHEVANSNYLDQLIPSQEQTARINNETEMAKAKYAAEMRAQEQDMQNRQKQAELDQKKQQDDVTNRLSLQKSILDQRNQDQQLNISQQNANINFQNAATNQESASIKNSIDLQKANQSGNIFAQKIQANRLNRGLDQAPFYKPQNSIMGSLFK